MNAVAVANTVVAVDIVVAAYTAADAVAVDTVIAVEAAAVADIAFVAVVEVVEIEEVAEDTACAAVAEVAHSMRVDNIEKAANSVVEFVVAAALLQSDLM